MASKKGQVTTELSTDKEWKEFVKRPGLLVIDLFSDWAGPCVAMNTPLKTLKTSEMAFEWMHLAFAPTSIAPALKRFDGTSRPTFVLLSGGRLVNVIFGCNAPRVIESIKSEIEREINASKGLEKRKTVSLTQLCPAEQDMQAARLAAEGDTLLAEQTRQAMEADRVLRTILTQIAENLPDTTLVVVFPHALQAEQCDGVLRSLRETWTEMGFTVAREEHVELAKEAVDLMFWERRLPQHDALVDSVTQGASLVLMLERSSEEGDEEDQEENSDGPEAIVARSVYGFLPGTGSSMEFISPVKEEPEHQDQDVTHPPEQEQQVAEESTPEDDDDNDVATPAPAKTEQEQGEEEEEDEEEGEEEGAGQVEAELRDATDQQEEGGGEEEKMEEEGGEQEDSLLEVLGELDDAGPDSPMRLWNPRELLPALDSAAARLLLRKDESGPALPGLWTPLTALTKAAAVKALFPNTAEQLYTPPTPPPPPPPPLSVVFFGGDKREEVLEVAANFPTEVTRYGFFTKNRKLLASARPDYEKLVRGGLQVAKTLLVLEVTRVRSAPLLELSSAGPQYVSATPAIAKNDVEDFFGSRCTPATAEDVREITKVVEQVPDEPQVVEAEVAGSQRPSASPEGGELPAESQPQGLDALPPSAPDAEPALPAPMLPMPEAGEGSIAPALDEMQGAVLDVGEGDAPVTGGEGDTLLD